MKRTKLSVRRETIRLLAGDNLRSAHGGGVMYSRDIGRCKPTISCDTVCPTPTSGCPGATDACTQTVTCPA
jgi:hypothetical protein